MAFGGFKRPISISHLGRKIKMIQLFNPLGKIIFTEKSDEDITFISFKPELLIRNLINNEQKSIARWLLTILALSSPVFLFQRILQIIFAVRLRDYVFQKILICAFK